MKIQETFDSVSKSYDSEALRFFAKSAKHVSINLHLRGDERVLDVATGTGHAALAIANCLPRGHVTGVDFSSGMLDEARRKASSDNLENVEFHERNMEALGFPADHFEVAVCAFGIFFIDDMGAQISHIMSVVKPGGQVAITTFQKNYFNPLKDMMFDRLAKYRIAKPQNTWKQVSSRGGCRELFKQAGLKNIRVELKNVGYHLPAVNDWWDVIWNAGYRRLVGQLSKADMERFKDEHLQEVDALKTAQGIWLDVPVLLTIGEKQ